MTLPEISVIVPLYDKAGTVGRAIRSVLAQTHRAFELIVVDDGSTDGSGAQAAAFDDPRLTVIAQANAGPGAARNRGVERSAGALLAFLDADDEWHADYLATAIDALAAHPQAVAFVAGYDAGAFGTVRPNRVRQLGRAGFCVLPIDLDGRALKHHVDALHSSCVVVRRAVFERLGGFYERDRCLFGEDSYLWAQVLFAGPIVWEPRELVAFHMEDSTLGRAARHRRKARPLLTEPEPARRTTPGAYRESLERLLSELRDLDIAALARTGCLGEVRRLRRLHPRAAPSLLQFARDRRIDLAAAWRTIARAP
jgi:glycosyltransferase involved in cell wall biosynthesis